MPRPVSIQNDAILKAARSIFLQRGFSATTAQVAQKAGVSEGSIFKRFKTKADLFMAAMDLETGGSSWEQDLMKSVETADIRQALENAGLQLLKHLQTVLPRVIMIRSSGIVVAPHHHGNAQTPGPLRKIHALAGYFRAEMNRGRLKMNNPDMYAQILVGTLTHYVIQEMLFSFRTAPPAAYVSTVVDMILRATATTVDAPHSKGPARRRPPRRAAGSPSRHHPKDT